MALVAANCVPVLIVFIVGLGTCTMEVLHHQLQHPSPRVALESAHLEIPPATRKLSNNTESPAEYNKMQTNSSNELISEAVSNHTSKDYDDYFDDEDDRISLSAIRTVLG